MRRSSNRGPTRGVVRELIVPFIDAIQSGLEGSSMNASFVPNAQRAVRGSTRSRLLRPMVVIAVVLMVSVLPTMARADSSERPTIVLVHGAWASSEGWDMVVAGLQKDGYRTATPTLGLQSIAEDVAIVRAALDNILDRKSVV